MGGLPGPYPLDRPASWFMVSHVGEGRQASCAGERRAPGSRPAISVERAERGCFMVLLMIVITRKIEPGSRRAWARKELADRRVNRLNPTGVSGPRHRAPREPPPPGSQELRPLLQRVAPSPLAPEERPRPQEHRAAGSGSRDWRPPGGRPSSWLPARGLSVYNCRGSRQKPAGRMPASRFLASISSSHSASPTGDELPGHPGQHPTFRILHLDADRLFELDTICLSQTRHIFGHSAIHDYCETPGGMGVRSVGNRYSSAHLAPMRRPTDPPTHHPAQ